MVLKVWETMPTTTPSSVVNRSGSAACSGVAQLPAVSIPCAWSTSRVRTIPSHPSSTVWFEAVVHTSTPVSAMASTVSCGARNRGQPVYGPSGAATVTS